MELDDYNKSFDEIVDTLDEEVDSRLRYIRRECVKDFIGHLNNRQQEWDLTFSELLRKSQEDDSVNQPVKAVFIEQSSVSKTSLFDLNDGLKSAQSVSDVQPTKENKDHEKVDSISSSNEDKKTSSVEHQVQLETKSQPSQHESKLETNVPSQNSVEKEFNDPHFSNFLAVKEFARIQQQLEENRKFCADFNFNSALKSYKNELSLFIKTQINSISNSDSQHLDTKTRLLTSLFSGQSVSFQDRLIDATKHPHGQLFSMDLAAQTFVTVGTRLVNSVPAVAKSMATVITGVANNNLPMFKDFVLGHLQERCPYLIPLKPKLEDFSGEGQEIKYKIACGYCYDSKSQTLESEEKYLSRMRSMVIIYACILIQSQMHQTWAWLASFLSLKPQPVISATILQAFLQEASKKMSSTYGRQYNKVLAFIKNQHIKMVDDMTPKTSDRQSFIKLKNLLSDNSNLIAAPSMSSIFGAVRTN